MTTSPPAPAPRWHDLDALRAFALFLGIVLHGVMSFMEPRIWMVDDTTHDAGANFLFFAIHIFRMTTFFVLSGFFARLLLEKRGPGGFLVNRLKRLGLPLVIFWPLVFAGIVAMMIIANMPAPGSPEAAIPPPPPPQFTIFTFPLTHLWFLYALLLMCVGVVILRLVMNELQLSGILGDVLDRVIGALVKGDAIAFLLATPVALMFYFSQKWIVWFGIPTPDAGLFLNPMAAVGFSVAFGFGYWLHRRSDLLDHLAQRYWVYLPLAMAGTFACWMMMGPVPSLAPTTGAAHPIYAVLYPLTSWAWALGLIGASRAWLNRPNATLRFLSDSSYWVYIVHLPLVLLAQFLVKPLDLAVGYKIVAVVMGTMGAGLLSYVLLVRYTFIGSLLNGRRVRLLPAKTTQTGA